MPATASSPIPAALDPAVGLNVPDLPDALPGLQDVLAQVVDPRARRGVRHRLVVVLAAAVCAVAAGARTYVAIAEWVADLPEEVAALLGLSGRFPSESTIRRLVQRVDGDRFDAAVGAWVQQQLRSSAVLRPAGRRRVIAVDGKVLHGTREHTGRPRHLLAAVDHDSRVVLGQRDVATAAQGPDGVAVDGPVGKAGEIAAFAPLLDTVDLIEAVVTADALHTQRGHAAYLHERGAHWVFMVKGNQPSLRRQIVELPWQGMRAQHRIAETHHGRREIRSIKIVTIAAGIVFPHAAQAIQVLRRTRPVHARSGKKGRWHSETVYAITDLRPHQARPEELAAWIRGHWQIENALHWVRDVAWAEDRSRVRTGNGPQVMATLRNLVISVLRLTGAKNIAAVLRQHGRNPQRSLTALGIT